MLYEMLTGKRAFRGETVSETLADVLKSEPPWAALPPETPATLRNILRRCLKKDPRQRVHDIADVRLAMEDAFETADAEPTAIVIPRLRVWERPVPLVAGIVALLGVTVLAVWFLTRPPPPRVVRLTVTPTGAAALGIIGGIAISPDGTRLAYVGAGPQQIVVRAFDQLQPTVLQGVDATGGLFFSPDGQWIGFFDGLHMLKKVAATGGPPVTVSRVTGIFGSASWITDDTIMFSTDDPASGLLRVAAGGANRRC